MLEGRSGLAAFSFLESIQGFGGHILVPSSSHWLTRASTAGLAYRIYVHVKKNIAAWKWKEIRMGSSGRYMEPMDWLILTR